MIRVGDLQRSIDFYTQVHGMKLLRQRGGKTIREAGPMNAGSTIIAFMEDPDGYATELLGSK
jgi:catechol 2,3-dioxygenase-like lactoylglutathione lyase family enzyme